MSDDAMIIRRIRQGDVEQFESLFRSSYVSLVRYARVIIKDSDTAEEIVQDLFFRLWQDRGKLKIESSLNGYLYRSVHNKCMHFIEHRKVIEKHAEEMSSMQQTTQEDPSDILSYEELRGRVTSILKKLPDRCGQIFYMSRFEDMKYSEIAEKLSVSIKTVEADMGRALKEFRKELKEQ